MRFHPVVLFAVACFTTVCQAQVLTIIPFTEDFYERQTSNEGFANGLTDWQFKNGTSEGVTSESWESMPDDSSQGVNRKFLSEPDDGRLDRVVKISGNNGIWQVASVSDAARFQVACCNARKRLIPGAVGPMGWAGFGVIYYDAAWQEVARFEQQIFDFKLNAWQLGGQGLSQYSKGTTIPSNAFYAILWLANDGVNTELWADDFLLLNEYIGVPLQDRTAPFGSRLRQNPLETNLIANNYFNGIITFDDSDVSDPFDVPGRSILCNSDFHWDGAGDLRRGELFGESAYWQFLDLIPEATYELSVTYRNSAPAVVGMDFYDEQWNYLGKVSEPLDGGFNFVFESGFEAARDTRRFVVPAGAKYSSFFIWQAPGEFNQLVIAQTALRPVAP